MDADKLRVTGRMTRVWRELTAAAAQGEAPLRWQAQMAFGDTWTSDGRFLAKDGAVLPEDGRSWPFMSMLTDNHGTGMAGMTSYLAGHGDRVWWDGNTLMGEGTFNTESAGMAAAQAIQDGDVVTVSVDTFPLEWEISLPVSEDDWLFFRRKVEGLSAAQIVQLVKLGEFTPSQARNWSMDIQEDAEGNPEAIVIHESMDDMPKLTMIRWEFLGVTQVPFAAFGDTRVEVLAALHEDMLAAGAVPTQAVYHGEALEPVTSEALTAGAAGLAPLQAPSEWFDVPEPDHYQALTVTKEGQVFGHVARWGECHTAYGVSMGQGEQCIVAPKSHSRYAYYHSGAYLTADGREVAVGTITLGTSHAELGMNMEAVRHHYEDTGSQAAYVVASDGKHGIWCCGTLSPQVPAEKVVEFRASKPSGDWRQINRHLELLGVLAVNIQGFPVPRARLVASGVDDAELVALVAAGYPEARLTAPQRRSKALRLAQGREGLLRALGAVSDAGE